MIRLALGAIGGAVLGVAIVIGWAAFARWGFDPASWSVESRAGFGLMALLAVVFGGVLGGGVADLSRKGDR